MTTDTQPRYLSFGEFRVDCRSGELRKNGREIRLQPQPAKLLVLLASRPGEVITREEIQKALWGDNTFVDFEHGINFSIKQIRDAIGDTSSKPRYIETVPRVGYRFLSPNPSDKPEESDRDSSPLSSHRRWLIVVVSLAVIAIGLLIWFRPVPPMEVARQPRFQLTLPRGVDLAFNAPSVLAISPDGRWVAFVGCGEGNCHLYLRERSDIDARRLPETEGAVGPFFSPDGRWLGFLSHGSLKKIDIETHIIVPLTDAPALRGASWAEDGTIIFSPGGSGLWRVSAQGGEAQEITHPQQGEYDHRWPQILPTGRFVLFGVTDESILGPTSGNRPHAIAVLNLDNGTTKTLVEAASFPRYTPSGHILFGRGGIVYAALFDLERIELLHSPLPVLEGVAMWSSPLIAGVNSGVASFDIARDGTILFSPSEPRLPKRTLVLLDRGGVRRVLSPVQHAYYAPWFSPDGQRIAVTIWSGLEADSEDAFVLDIRSGAWTRLVVNNDDSTAAIARFKNVAGWMPQGERVLVRTDKETFLVSIDGSLPTERLPFTSPFTGVAPDGQAFLSAINSQPGDWDIWRTASTVGSKSEPWLATADEEVAPTFSPNGKWVTYESNRSGRDEIYVRPYGESNLSYQISTAGGESPRWSRRGGEIFFVIGGGLWSAQVRTSPTFSAKSPRKLFDIPDDIDGGLYDVSPDDQGFLMVQRDPLELRPLDLVIVPGWIEEMKARLTASK